MDRRGVGKPGGQAGRGTARFGAVPPHGRLHKDLLARLCCALRLRPKEIGPLRAGSNHEQPNLQESSLEGAESASPPADAAPHSLTVSSSLMGGSVDS